MKQTPPQAKRLGWLDAMRGIAALAVVYQHYFGSGLTLLGWNMPRRFLWGALDPGRFGVVLFFAISGYIITYSLAKDEENRAPVSDFIIHRLFRLYPAYWFSLILAIVIGSFGLRQILWNVSMLQQFVGQENIVAAYWTLQIELIFYVICGCVYGAGFIRDARAPFWLCRAALILALAMAVVRYYLGLRLPVVLPLSLAVMFLGYAWRLVSTGQASMRDFWLLMLQFEIFLLPSSLLSYGTKFGLDWSWYFGTYSAGMLAFLALSRWRISWTFMIILGQISYSLYLLHQPILQGFAGDDPHPSWTTLLLALSVTLVASFAVYRLVERPFIVWGHRIVSRTMARRANAIGSV